MKSLDEIIDAAFERLAAMPQAEFQNLLDECERESREAIINGTEHLGNSLWFMKDPEGYEKFEEEVLREHEKLQNQDREGKVEAQTSNPAQADSKDEGQN